MADAVLVIGAVVVWVELAVDLTVGLTGVVGGLLGIDIMKGVQSI